MKKILLLTLIALTSACTSTSDLGAGKTGKSIVVTGKSYDQVWNASVAAVKEITGDQSWEVEKNLHISKEDKAAGRIEANTGMSLWSWGEVVGVFITPPNNAAQHKIEVESRAKMKTNVTSNNWEDEVIANIKKKLNVK